MLKSLVSPHYSAVEPRHQLVPSPSHSVGAASPVSMTDTWSMNELGVWFDENSVIAATAPLCRIKQEPQSAPSSPQSSCMMNQNSGGGGMLDYPSLLEELVNVTKNCVAQPQRSVPTPVAAPAPGPNALVAQPGSPSMYDEPCSGLVRCHGGAHAAAMYAAGGGGASKPCRPPPPSYDQRLVIKTEDCVESDAAADCCTSLSADKLDQIRLLAMQQAAKDIDVACQILNISPNPYQWSVANVHSWLVWTQQQYGCPTFRTDYFNMNGATLCSLSEDDFRLRAPGSGDIFSAQLEIWKSAAHLRTSEQNHQQSGNQRTSAHFCPEDSVLDLASLLGQTISGSGAAPDASPPRTSPLSHHSDSHSDATHSDDDASDASSDIAERCLGGVGIPVGASGATAGGVGVAAGAASRAPSSSHIHLWQFLKELLSQPQLYGSCIRWLDRSRGVFKIEDSVRVARLWGKRKNRPAMNYDKLSRSIRQYYKKGIMKKTERSQRLVYQFCAPYSC